MFSRKSLWSVVWMGGLVITALSNPPATHAQCWVQHVVVLPVDHGRAWPTDARVIGASGALQPGTKMTILGLLFGTSCFNGDYYGLWEVQDEDGTIYNVEIDWNLPVTTDDTILFTGHSIGGIAEECPCSI